MALGRIGDVRVIEPLSEALEVEDQDFVRRAIVQALDIVSDSKAITSLIKGLGHVNRDVRELATELLANKGSETVEFLVNALGDPDRDIRNGVEVTLAKIGSQAIEPLIQALDSENQIVRVEAAWLLGEFGDKRVIGPLTQALKDEEVRITADKALKKITRKADNRP